MFNSQIDLRSPSVEFLKELIKNTVPQSDGTIKLIGPVILPGDRVTWKSGRYGWTEGTVQEVRIRRGHSKYERVNGEWTKTYPGENLEQVVVTGEYKYSNGHINRSTVVMHPSSLIKVNKGQSAQ